MASELNAFDTSGPWSIVLCFLISIDSLILQENLWLSWATILAIDSHKFSRKMREPIEIEKHNTIDQEGKPLDSMWCALFNVQNYFLLSRMHYTCTKPIWKVGLVDVVYSHINIGPVYTIQYLLWPFLLTNPRKCHITY